MVGPGRPAVVCPVRLAGKDVLGAPDAASRGRDVRHAVTWLTGLADSDRRRSSPCDVPVGHVAEGVPERRGGGERLAPAGRYPRAPASLSPLKRPRAPTPARRASGLPVGD